MCLERRQSCGVFYRDGRLCRRPRDKRLSWWCYYHKTEIGKYFNPLASHNPPLLFLWNNFGTHSYLLLPSQLVYMRRKNNYISGSLDFIFHGPENFKIHFIVHFIYCKECWRKNKISILLIHKRGHFMLEGSCHFIRKLLWMAYIYL